MRVNRIASPASRLRAATCMSMGVDILGTSEPSGYRRPANPCQTGEPVQQQGAEGAQGAAAGPHQAGPRLPYTRSPSQGPRVMAKVQVRL